ncbi:MAG TPA: aminotransferase class V-fold PLP-dependent enzyme, partial [Planctomycetota bacterium]|nr:aminotransferase class V-fold PLP-dependent enzyme [Planctomycetota bacterium]
MTDEAYFDYAATAPPFPEALRRFDEVSLQFYGNPSSTHGRGKKARETLDRAREAFLARLGFHDGRLILTSGATEANNLVIRDTLERHPSGRLLLAADAHPSAWFAKEHYGKRVDILRTDPRGRISPECLAEGISRK